MRPIRHVVSITLCTILLAGCSRNSGSQPGNPAAPGFDAAGSDAKAIEIADRVMQALGGRQAWDQTRFLAWRFFGKRLHVWDKQAGRDRIEYSTPEGEAIVLVVNVDDATGRAWKNGKEVTDAAELAELLKGGREMWINDSYWMFMPWKLKDSGVTLKYVGESDTLDGRQADMLELTFKGVGVTPQNKYHVWVARDTNLVVQWAYFADASDPDPRFTVPWDNWKPYGSIMLSDQRGEGRTHTDLGVYKRVPGGVFTSPEPLDRTEWEK